MNINLNNYELYFLMYVDNELSQEERQAVEAFVGAHPELNEEFRMLNQAKLIPDESIRFEPKEILYRHSGSALSPEWEEKLLLYIDGEMSPADKLAFEQRLASDANLRKELDIYRQTLLQPDTSIVFADKNALYKEEKEPARVIYFNWRRIAVAAALLLTASTGVLFFLRQGEDKVENPSMAGTTSEKTIGTQHANTRKDIAPENTFVARENQVIPAGNDNDRQPADKNEQPKKVKSSPSPVANDQDQKPVYLADKGNLNNLPKPRNQDLLNNQDNNKAVYATLDPSNTTVTPERHITKADPVQAVSNTLDPSLNVNNGIVTNPSYATYNITDDGNKRSRGLLRKVTRIFEKTTHVKATTDDNKLLIGSFAVSLK